MPARKSNLHPSLLQSASLSVSWNCSVYPYRYNRSGRPHSWFRSLYQWWWERLECWFRFVRYNDHFKRSAGKIRSVFANGSHFHAEPSSVPDVLVCSKHLQQPLLRNIVNHCWFLRLFHSAMSLILYLNPKTEKSKHPLDFHCYRTR